MFRLKNAELAYNGNQIFFIEIPVVIRRLSIASLSESGPMNDSDI